MTRTDGLMTTVRRKNCIDITTLAVQGQGSVLLRLDVTEETVNEPLVLLLPLLSEYI